MSTQRDTNVLRRPTFALPADLSPANTRCIQVTIPDSIDHLAAFYGAISLLAAWTSWERDPDHGGAIAAQAWKNVLALPDFMTTCDGQPIILEGWDWDMGPCEGLRWNNGVLEGLCCGEWAPIPTINDGPIPGDQTQPDSGSRPAAGESQCFPRSLTARDTFLVPFGVQDNDIVTVSALSGAWSNDAFRWTCTDGTPFALGICTGTRYHDAADPDPTTLYHGQLMLEVGGQMISATDGPVTLSGLSGLQQLVVRPNFLPDNGAGGTIQFNICIENGSTAPAADWCFGGDMTLSDYGIVGNPAVAVGTGGIWTAGVGYVNDDWEEPVGNFYRGLDLLMTIPSTNLSGVEVEYDLSGLVVNGFNSSNPCAALEINGTPYGAVLFNAQSDGTGKLLIASGALTGTTTIRIFIVSDYEPSASLGGSVIMKRITLTGAGFNPFGTSNC